jgi:hypothetical protein
MPTLTPPSAVSLLFEIAIQNGLLLDAAGIVGLGLLGLAAIKLARRDRSWGGNLMASSAIALLLVRLFVVVSPHLLTPEVLLKCDPRFTEILSVLPPLLLTLGLAGIVWGLWSHERWLHQDTL